MDDFLGQLGRAFGVAGAGYTSPLGVPAPATQRVYRDGARVLVEGWPWRPPHDWTTEVRDGQRTEERIGPAGESFLIAAIPAAERPPRLLWLEEPPGRVWHDAEKAALLLAGQVFGRTYPLPPGGTEPPAPLDQAPLRQRLHDAAIISGRVAHAFDNVLTGIVGFAELALSQATDPTLQQYLGEVLQASQLGIQLTQQMHQFNRCATPGTGPTRVALVAADEEGRLRQTLNPRVTLTVAVPNDLPPVAIDPDPLRQVLGHLLDNACESLSGGGTVSLSARLSALDEPACGRLFGSPRPGRCLEVTIADSGGGLSPEARQRLFREPFFTSKPRHRGLGLAIVYRILHAHHGGFQLEAGPQGGTVARVFLPLADDSAAPPVGAVPQSPRRRDLP